MEDQVSMLAEVSLRQQARDRLVSLIDDLPTAVLLALLPVFARHAAEITLAAGDDAAPRQEGGLVR